MQYIFHTKLKEGTSINVLLQILIEISTQLDIGTKGLPEKENYILLKTWKKLSNKPLTQQQACMVSIILTSDIKNTHILYNPPSQLKSHKDNQWDQ